MSWQTDLYTAITFNRKSYNSLQEVESDLEDARQTEHNAYEIMEQLAFMTEPQKFCGEDSPEQYLRAKLDYIREGLQDSIIEQYKLELLRDSWKACHDEKGQAISLVVYDTKAQESKGIPLTGEQTKAFWEGDLAFLDGDYVRIV